jgi:hypothetical protein
MTDVPHRSLPDDRRLADVSLKALAVRERPSQSISPPSSERRDHSVRDALVRRVRSEFEELRGQRLTLPQARRLFGLREEVCARILDGLGDEGLLMRTRDGQYRRKDVA